MGKGEERGGDGRKDTTSKLALQVMATLQGIYHHPTAWGPLNRVDLRLRPYLYNSWALERLNSPKALGVENLLLMFPLFSCWTSVAFFYSVFPLKRLQTAHYLIKNKRLLYCCYLADHLTKHVITICILICGLWLLQYFMRILRISFHF